MVARLDTAGAPDPGFGTGGIVQWPGVEDGEVFDLALEADGSILAAGAGRRTRSTSTPDSEPVAHLPGRRPHPAEPHRRAHRGSRQDRR